MMPDPTEMVLTGGFAAALVIFAISAGIRGFSRRGAEEDDGRDGDSSMLSPAYWTGPGRVRVGVYGVQDLAGVAFVFLVFAGLVLSLLAAEKPQGVAIKAEDLWTSIGFQFIMAAVVTTLMIRRVGVADWLGLRWKSWPWLLVLAPCSVLFMWAIFFGLDQIGYMQWIESLGVQTMQESVKLLQDEKNPEVLGLMAVTAVVVAPLCEELVFRGYFYPVLKKFSGTWTAAICSALVFACAHGSLSALLPLFVFGLLLVFLYEKTGSIWAPIATHFCFNGATVVIQFATRLLGLPGDVNP